MKFTTLTALVGTSAAIGVRSHDVETDIELAQADWRHAFIARLKKYREDNAPKPDPVSEESESEEEPSPSPSPTPTPPSNQKDNSVYKTCSGAIQRMEDENKMNIAHGSSKFEDKSFAGANAEYWEYHLSSNYHSSTANLFKSNPNWKRVTEMDSNPSLWGSKGVQEHAINQGQLGDCWLLSGISSLGEYADRVKKMFEQSVQGNTYPADGLFKIKLWSAGQQYTINIDDKFPVNNWRNPQPFLNRKSPNGAWWGSLVEKASAKFYGTYTAMRGGNVWEAFYLLTGMPAIAHRTSGMTEAAMWSQISDADSMNYPLSASCNNGFDGLVGGHAYTMLGVATVDGVKLIKMRNPWGSGEYKGPWSDESDLMKNAIAAKKIDHVINKGDGSFFIPIGEWKKGFYQYTINYYDIWRKQTKIVDVAANAAPSFTLTNPVNQRALLGTAGHNSRQFMSNDCKDDKKMWASGWRVSGPDGKLDPRKDSGVVNSTGMDYFWAQGPGAFVSIQNLKAGKYTLVSWNKRNTAGKIAVVTFAKNANITIDNQGQSV